MTRLTSSGVKYSRDRFSEFLSFFGGINFVSADFTENDSRNVFFVTCQNPGRGVYTVYNSTENRLLWESFFDKLQGLEQDE